MAAPFRGRGIVTHAIRAVADWALGERGLGRVDFHVEPWNVASWRAVERAGFACEGLCRAVEAVGPPDATERRDMFRYARTPGAADPAVETARLLEEYRRHVTR